MAKLQEKDLELENAEKLGIHQEQVILILESGCQKTLDDLLSKEEEQEGALDLGNVHRVALAKLQEQDQELEMAEKLGIHQEKVILNLESDCLKTWNDLLSMEEELERANQAAKNLEKRYSDLGKSKKVVIKMLKRNSKKLKKAERLGRKFRIKLVQAESKLKATVQQSSELLQQVSHGMSDRLNVVG